ncbi:hypothetical protein D3C87_1905920 [compost metagenome]
MITVKGIRIDTRQRGNSIRQGVRVVHVVDLLGPYVWGVLVYRAGHQLIDHRAFLAARNLQRGVIRGVHVARQEGQA